MSNSKCYLYAIRLLAARDYSEYKLRRKISSKEYTKEEIDDAISIVKDKGYLNEENYAKLRIQGMIYKNQSQNFIKRTLSNEKLDVSLDKINEIYSEMDQNEAQQIENIINKKLPILSKRYDKVKTKNKLIYHLISKGHSYGNFSSILNNLLQ